MAMPIDVSIGSTHGRYDPAPVLKRGSYSVLSPDNRASQGVPNGEGLSDAPYEFEQSTARTWSSPLDNALNGMRDFFGRNVCGCCYKLPAYVLLVLVLCLFGLFLLFAVLLFMLSTNGTASPLTLDHVGKDMLLEKFAWPAHKEIEEDPSPIINTLMLMPPNVSSCRGYGFACTARPDEVIPTFKRCNGIADCSDSSDETHCKKCLSRFQCPLTNGTKNRVCLTGKMLCDGVKQCADGWDETEYCLEECQSDQFMCEGQVKDGLVKCLPRSAVCDGVKDCPKGDDEKDCSEEACVLGAKKCPIDGTCIGKEHVCDSVVDCLDGSDEKDCDCVACSGKDRAVCGDGTCIAAHRICDRVWDCTDGMDEKNCPGTCPLDEELDISTVVCPDQLAYNEEDVCAGLVPSCAHKCPKKECDEQHAFKCNDGKCIPRGALCDGVKDCKNGEDEKKCPRCDINNRQWKCLESKQCVDFDKRCDGVWDCPRGSDEASCDDCPENSFVCKADSQCLPLHMRCDGREDCRDASDEMDCTCEECMQHGALTVVCEGEGSCVRRAEMCGAASKCKVRTKADEFFCSTLNSTRLHEL